MEQQQLPPQPKKALYKYLRIVPIIIISFYSNNLFSQNYTIQIESIDSFDANYSIALVEGETRIDKIDLIAPAQIVLHCDFVILDTVIFLFYVTNGSRVTKGKVLNFDKYVINNKKIVRQSHEGASVGLNKGLLCSTFQIKSQVLVFESDDKSFLKGYNINGNTDINILINEILNDLKNNVECPKYQPDNP